MPHLDYLTYLSQIFWFLVFFWIAYFLFFFVFFPKLYYSFRIRKLKFEFLFDKYISNEYKVNFYSFFFKDYSEKFIAILFSFLKFTKSKYNISLSNLNKKIRFLNFYLNVSLSNVFYFYWSRGISINFFAFLNSVFFTDVTYRNFFNQLNNFYLIRE